MATGELKTQRTKASVKEFIDGVEDEQRRADCRRLLTVMKDATGAAPQMWGPSIVGFGNFQYEAAPGRMNDWFVAGFSPRKQNLTVYMSSGYARYADLMKRLGKHNTGGGCLYIKNLDDIDEKVLRELIANGVRDTPKRLMRSDRGL